MKNRYKEKPQFLENDQNPSAVGMYDRTRVCSQWNGSDVGYMQESKLVYYQLDVVLTIIKQNYASPQEVIKGIFNHPKL